MARTFYGPAMAAGALSRALGGLFEGLAESETLTQEQARQRLLQQRGEEEWSLRKPLLEQQVR